MEEKGMSYAELEFRLKRETEKRIEAEELKNVEEAKGQRRQMVIVALLKRLGKDEVIIEKTELAKAVETKVDIQLSGDKFTITIK